MSATKSTARQPALRAQRQRRAPSWFVPLESKLHVPAPRAGLVLRPRLLEQLAEADGSPLILVTAPPGYGKTTLLAQWAAADGRPFVWVTLDGTDNDASRLLSYIALALTEVLDLGSGILPPSREPGPSFAAFAFPRLVRALRTRDTPFVLVLDDVHVIEDRESLDLMSMLAQNLPDGSQVVLTGRAVPSLPLSRLLVSHSLVTVGARQLAMTVGEGASLLRAAGLVVDGPDAEMLVERTEGWAAGLYLAALTLRDEHAPTEALRTFAGSDGLLSDYLKDELLERLPEDWLEFMLGTAALDRLSGPLCDAVLGTSGSARKLDAFERANLFLIATNRNRTWFRRHQLFAELLMAELRRRSPAQEALQHRRAAAWYEADGDPDSALQHASAAGKYELAAQIISRNMAIYLATGRAATLRRWIESLPAAAVADLPWFGAAATLAYVSSGDIERATYWLAVAERGSADAILPDGRRSLASAVAIGRAALGLGGVAQLLTDASTGYDLEAEGSPWRAFCAFLQGTALHLRGERQEAVAKLDEAVSLSALEVPNVRAWSLAQLSACAVDAGDWESARDHAERARAEVERSGLGEYASACAVYAVCALAGAHGRRPAEARRDAARARRLFATLSGLTPWMSVQGRVITAEAYLLLGDPGEARETLRPARRDLARVADAPLLGERFERASQAAATRHDAALGPPLTAAEIRVLQFLPTHLSFRQIAERLHVSRNTVKTQVISAYRKLGASSRAEAVDAARRIALLEEWPGE